VTVVAAINWSTRQLAAYRAQPPLSINVNVSSRQLAQPGVVDEVAEVLEATRLEPTSLVIEITEAALAKLRDLKALGVRLAVDDFGTGYSSLGYLRRFPFDVLKLDKSFVDGVTVAPEELLRLPWVADQRPPSAPTGAALDQGDERLGVGHEAGVAARQLDPAGPGPFGQP
jgi:hypothetical protein